MKTAEEWQEHYAGETSLESIRTIQADALLHALLIMRQRGPITGRDRILTMIDELSQPATAQSPDGG